MMDDLRAMLKELVLLLACLAVMGAGAYTVGLIEHWNREKMEASVYGLAGLYEGYENPTMPIYFWQGKGSADPSYVDQTTTSHTGDVLGNSGAFSLRRLKMQTTVDSVDWTGYDSSKVGYSYYATPTFTIENTTGGDIFVVYQYSGYGNLVYSADTDRLPIDITRRPVEYNGWLANDWAKFISGFTKPTFPGSMADTYFRADVYTNHNAFAEGPGKVLVHVMYDPFTAAESPGTSSAKVPDVTVVPFLEMYPTGGDVMKNVFRWEATTYLDVYAMDPDDPDKVIVEAEVRLEHYSAWFRVLSDGSASPLLPDCALTEEQEQVLAQSDAASHWGCEVTMGAYQEYLQLVG